MDANTVSYVVRSLQKYFADNFSAATVRYENQRYAAKDSSEWCEFALSGPRFSASRDNRRLGDVTVSVNVFCKLSKDLHRVHELAGAVAYALDRQTVEIKNYPAASPTHVGWVRLAEAEIVTVGMPLADGANQTPLAQVNVTIEGTISFS